MINWEGVTIENGTYTMTEYPDGGGISLELTIPLLILLFIVIIIQIILDWRKSSKKGVDKKC